MNKDELPPGHFTPWTVYGKVYRGCLPLLCVVSAMCYIDRTNLAYASFSMTKELSFSPTVYGAGSGLFFAGYSVAIIPSQLLGLRVGVARWLSIQVAIWGIVATSFSLITTVTQFYVLRFLLGMAEAGAFPAIWYYLYLMLPKEALTFPYSSLEAAVSLANVLSAPLAALLMMLHGRMGLSDWQWLFLFEGVATCCIGATVGVALPTGLHQATFLTGLERRWIQQQQQQQGRSSRSSNSFSSTNSLSSSNMSPSSSTKNFGDAEVLTDVRLIREAAGNWRVWYVSVMGLLKNIAGNAMLFWLPIIVSSLMEDWTSIGHDNMVPEGATRNLSLTSTSSNTAPGGPMARTQHSHSLSSTASHVLLSLHSNTGAAAGNPALLLPPAFDRNQAPSAFDEDNDVLKNQGTSYLPVLLSSLPFLATAVTALLLGRSSQARNERALHIAVPYLTAGLLFLVLPLLHLMSVVLVFTGLTLAIAFTHGADCIMNSYIPVVSTSRYVSLAMAMYNSFSNLGGIAGPWLVGALVEVTGSYNIPLQLMGCIMCLAAVMAYGTKSWEVAGESQPSKLVPAAVQGVIVAGGYTHHTSNDVELQRLIPAHPKA
ncbi:hypothetical protein CEUSTIGMA_g8245.t1 [Chlamydomonas eustigma]|uniref:Major facilitator superfamily (MFS) profile domain-containing protein n=1 Tax=Chlamydomonas eustigma TaxID=1157962 RepID=A0A250XD37_9CHLO|nr:hypothetical protein CEUSTIGMA_g8245.t1 [Chlamydomonas eustigma]|eukprot:GAX80809.1 hypothetical protein CEUSTIGMA_g8245.t1 [Chlamydomonas eustigma]